MKTKTRKTSQTTEQRKAAVVALRDQLAGETWNDPDGYDRSGAWDGFQVVSDAEGCL